MVTLVGLLASARAQTVVVDIDAAKAQALGLDPADVQGELSSLIADTLQTQDNDAYMAKYANATAIATKGMGVDYASNPEKFSVGVSFGPAVSGVPFSLGRGGTDLPEGGFALMAAAHAGVNLGLFVPGEKNALDHVLVYVSGLALNPPGGEAFTGSMYNFGIHGQVSVGGPAKMSPAVEWGGLALTGGYELSHYKLGLSQELPLDQKVDAATVTWTATGTYDLSATANTIPLELSTNLRLTILTLFVGGGYDLNVSSSADSVASLSGPIDAKAAGQKERLGSASVTMAGLGQADPGAARVFGGAQFNLALFKIYGHLNVGLNQTYGANVGVRLAL